MMTNGIKPYPNEIFTTKTRNKKSTTFLLVFVFSFFLCFGDMFFFQSSNMPRYLFLKPLRFVEIIGAIRQVPSYHFPQFADNRVCLTEFSHE